MVSIKSLVHIYILCIIQRAIYIYRDFIHLWCIICDTLFSTEGRSNHKLLWFCISQVPWYKSWHKSPWSLLAGYFGQIHPAGARDPSQAVAAVFSQSQNLKQFGPRRHAPDTVDPVRLTGRIAAKKTLSCSYKHKFTKESKLNFDQIYNNMGWSGIELYYTPGIVTVWQSGQTCVIIKTIPGYWPVVDSSGYKL